MRLVAGVTHDLRSSGGEGLLYRGSQRTFSVHCRKSVLGWGHPGGQGEGRGGLQDDPVNIQPAAKRLGITKRIGWHTFRRTYTTLLHANGEDVKVVQELLRHGSARITMDVYAQAMTPAKRLAQGKVVAMLRDGEKKTV